MTRMTGIALSVSLLLGLAAPAGSAQAKEGETVIIGGRKVRLNKEDPNQGKAALSSFTEDPVVGEDREKRIRKDIPVLQAVEKAEARYVNPDDLYERAIAMLETGKTFDQALVRTCSPDGEDDEEVTSNRPHASEVAEEPSGNFKIIMVAAFLTICMGLYWKVHRWNGRSTG